MKQAAQTFAIPAQALTSALDKFSEQTGISFAYTSSELEGIQSPGVRGEFAPRQALNALLAGTGVSAQFSGGDTVALSKAADQTGAMMLGPVRVAGSTFNVSISEETGYRAERSVSATKTDVPIMETPASVQVVTQEVMEDQQVLTINDAVKNVSGVYENIGPDGNAGDYFIVRGFETDSYLLSKAESLNPRTLDLHLTAIGQWHHYQGFTDPVRDPLVRKTIVGVTIFIRFLQGFEPNSCVFLPTVNTYFPQA